MPRIRKKTSNRQNTRDRAKITKKVAEHKKKSKRDVKRNTTWKSNKKPDIGVPNSFHMKDQVLAEFADEKRRAAEERERRKGLAKGTVEEESDAPGISSIANTEVRARAPLSGVSAMPVEVDSDDDDVPALLDSDLPTLMAALDAADVLIEVVDARDVNGGRSKHVETLVSDAGGKVLIAINKADLVPREALEAWLAVLPFPAVIVSSRESLGREQLLSTLAVFAKAKKGGEPLKAALLGLPNVGKTALLNSLLGKEQFKTAANVPGNKAAKHPVPTTPAPVEVEVGLPGGKSVHIIDTPGWEYVEEEDDEDEDEENDEDEEESEEDEAKWDALEERVAGDLLRRNLGRVDRVKEVFPLVNWIIQRSNAQDLMLKYNVPYFESGDVETFLTGLARVNQRVKKFGEPNHDAAARILLRDWAENTFPYYAVAPKASAGGMDVDEVASFSKPDMSAVLAACKSRKEMKAGRGGVRFRSGDVDEREIFLDDDYTALAEAEADSDDESGCGCGHTHGDEHEHDDEDEDEDEDDEDMDDEDDAEELIIGSSEGEEAELASGSEPESGSDVEEEDDEDSESPEPEVEVRAGKRKRQSLPAPSAKKAKTVNFSAKLEAPRSKPSGATDVKPILKPAVTAPVLTHKAARQAAQAAAVAEGREAARAERALKKERQAAIEAKLKAKKAAKKEAYVERKAAAAEKEESTSKKSKKVNGAAAPAANEAYDFSKHFF